MQKMKSWRKKIRNLDHFVKDGTPPKPDREKKVDSSNIGHLSKNQVKEKLEKIDVQTISEDKKKKKNRNGMVWYGMVR